MELKRQIMDARVLLGMLLVQVIATGLQILSRVILSEGIFVFALMTYRHIVAAFTIAPFALYFERIMMAMGLFYYGLKDTTATYATNFLNLVPVVTFLFSLILRIEKLRLRGRGGKMKSIGAMLCLAGALTMALYKGKSFNLTTHSNHHKILIKANQNKTRGTIFLIGSCICYGFWFILQAKLFKVFPHKCSATLAICIIASVQATVMGLCLDTRPNSWRLGWNLQLITIFYSGVLATAVTFALFSIAITQKGPTYPAMFNPLGLILVLLIEALFFAENLYLGSLMGMVLIIAGLYSFLWGSHKDMKALKIPDDGRNGDLEITPEFQGLQSSPATVSPKVTSH